MNALMSAYIETNWSEGFQPDLDGFVLFCLRSENPKLKSLFLMLYHFMMPTLVKWLGLRLHRIDIADGGAALGKLLVCSV